MHSKAFLASLVMALAACKPAALSPREKLSTDLRRALAQADPRSELRVLVDLSEQVDLDALATGLRERRLDKRARREMAVAALRRVAARSQARLDPVLERLRRRGAITTHRGFVVVNRLLVTGSPKGILALAERDEVAAIALETPAAVPILAGRSKPPVAGRVSRSWAIGALGADSAWRLGLDGRGTVVGIIDAGASADHEQLRDGFRQDDRSWFDPVVRRVRPVDIVVGHGTQVLSVAVGRNVNARVLGVAPGAQWIACAGVPDGHYNNVALTECADWMLTVGQPDVLVNAWLLPGAGCDTSLRRIVDAWRVAEIYPVFPAGNAGPERGTDRSPANYAGALSVGGITRSGAALRGSGRGPSSCGGATYPSIVAPAEAVPAAFPLTTTSYIDAEGTSIGAGLAAGAVAVLLQRHPNAGVVELDSALTGGAVDLGPPGPDDVFGYGRLYLPAGLAALDRLMNPSRRVTGFGR